MPFVQNRSLEGGHNAFGTIDHLGGGSAGQQNGELVASETRDATTRRHDTGETLRNMTQYVIPDTVAQRVVHILEPIEIHHEDGNRLDARARSSNRRRQQGRELGAIGQPSELILIGERQNALLALCDTRAHVIQTVRQGADLIVRGQDGATAR